MNYETIVKILNLDAEKDLEAARILNNLMIQLQPNLKSLENILHNNYVIIFGAGPSLKEDISEIKKYKLHKTLKIIAADGAVKALLEEHIIPDILVTDLDGDQDAIIEANKLGVITIVHAHGDNISRLKEVVPKLKNVIGTTQTKETGGKLKNFGGFTDGDRAVFLARRFKAKLIILAGMDFGKKIGTYSGTYIKEKKLKKLKIGKALIEELAQNLQTTVILNITEYGEPLREIPKISVKELKILLE
jgi:hypothetical protein